MNFSFEELYFHFGQYDRFVTIQFKINSQAYNDFGVRLMGLFKYTRQEREELEIKIKEGIENRTNRRVKFDPSELESLSDSQKTTLDRDGIYSADIELVSFLSLNSENRFSINEVKQIPGLMNIEFNSDGFDANKAMLYLYSKRMKKGPKLCPDELLDYYGILLYYFEKKLNHIPTLFYGSDGKIKSHIQYYKYLAVFNDRVLTDIETEDFNRVALEVLMQRVEVIKRELISAGSSFEAIVKLNIQYIYIIARMCEHFKGETLLLCKFPVWWDFERYIHIYFRHVKQFKFESIFQDKTNFRYELKFVQKVIEIVLDQLKDEIELHFTTTPDKPFKRIGTRSTYYDGAYYQVDIEPSGRLLRFHPLN